jgi:serine/threonine protein phosphatase PrpC
MQLQISVLSEPGGREPNEDAFGVWSTEGACFCVVSDGAGGHGGGDVASKLAVSTVLARFEAAPECTGAAIEGALRGANEAIVAQQAGGARLAGMRATAVVLAVDTVRATATWGHLGDSRLYGFRAGRVVVQTKDHSVVQRMVDAGYLPPEGLRSASERSRLFAALGDTEGFVPAIGPAARPVADGDAFLLCTDGFWEYVDEARMIATLAAAASPEAWLRAMEADVVAGGGPDQDNYSALAVWCGVAAAAG